MSTNPFAVVQTEQPTVDDLAAEYLAAKQAVHDAQTVLHDIEKRIVYAVGVKDEGSFSVKGDTHKVTTTQPVTRRFTDEKLARDLWQKLPKDIAEALIQWKPSLSVRVYKELEKYQPETFKEISRVVVSKPGKPSVKVEVIA